MPKAGAVASFPLLSTPIQGLLRHCYLVEFCPLGRGFVLNLIFDRAGPSQWANLCRNRATTQSGTIYVVTEVDFAERGAVDEVDEVDEVRADVGAVTGKRGLRSWPFPG